MSEVLNYGGCHRLGQHRRRSPSSTSAQGIATMMAKPTPQGKMNVNHWLSPTLLVSAALVCTSCATGEKEKTVVVLTTGAARNVTRMTQTPQDETNPSVSPDGKTVAFQVRKDNQYDIWTMDSATGRNVIQATSHPS